MGIFDLLKQLFARSAERLPPPDQGHGVGELARRLDMPTDQLPRIVPRYHQYTIAKRRGGERTITAPTPPFKSFQRRLHRRVIGRLPVHPAAVGFRPGQSIATHALLHAMKPVVVKMDIRNFFSETRQARVHAYFRRVGWNQEATRLLVRWCIHDGGLPQGAATSPHLSNAVNYRLDARLWHLAARIAVAPRGPESTAGGTFYSRYADDLTFSFATDDHRAIQGAIAATQLIVKDEGYRLHTRKKLRVMRRHDRQIVTGLVVNEAVNLPRERRRWLRAVEHHLATGRPASLTAAQVQGWRALQHMVAQQTGKWKGA
jgi:hypothetical protein